MGVVPTNRLGKIEFYESHNSAWATNAVAIGLTAGKVTALATLTTNARKSYDAHVTAQAAAKAATQTFYDAVRAMHSSAGAGADMIETIKNFAQTTGNPTVYNLAQIPPPATPGTTPPPGTPFKFTVGLTQEGAIELKWKCDNPSGTQGTIYEVRRKIGGSGSTNAFTFVGATGVKKFLDDTLPTGSSNVTYQVTAVRSTSRGTPAQFNVNFGVGGDGQAFATITNENNPGVKMAA